MASTLSPIALQLPGTLLDDALAIVQFPCPDAIDDDPEIVDRYLETWASGRISQSESDEQTQCKLQQFCEKMTFYIEDYVSKATSPFLPRAYLDIPSPLPHTQTGEKHAIKMKDLSSDESNRLMTAFIEHELLCKVNYSSRFETEFDFRALERFTGRTVSPWRAETLNCVFEYIRSIYGALFAHSANAWLPTDHTQLVFPDNILLSVGQYAEDMDLHHKASALTAGILAAHGFDLVTSLLKECGVVSGEPRLGRSVFHGLARWMRRETYCRMAPEAWLNPLSVTPNLSWPDSPGLCQRLLQLIPATTDEESRWLMALGGGGGNRIDQHLGTQLYRQLQVYRQRAWVFFDDERLFPESSGLMPTFPTAEEIMSAEAQTIHQYINPNTARANHRSRFWHETKMPPYMDPARTAVADEDPWAGKDGTTEELLRGLHEALKPRLMPFWK